MGGTEKSEFGAQCDHKILSSAGGGASSLLPTTQLHTARGRHSTSAALYAAVMGTEVGVEGVARMEAAA